jgi:hypothetical protein
VFTLRLTDVVCVAEAPVPVTVTVDAPDGVDTEVAIVKVELWPDAIVVGLNDADVPGGRPDALNTTLCG